MDTGQPPECGPPVQEEEEEEEPVEPASLVAAKESFSGISVVDAPILFLVSFHKAFRLELAELRALVCALAEEEEAGRRSESVVRLRERFEFLKVAYKYHCAAEDEVIFLALDSREENIVNTYSLEHQSTDDLFDSVFQFLNGLIEQKGDQSKLLEELSFSVGMIQTSICRHMLKEEKQVFPLLMRQFSPKEQASLVWQFLSSVPMILLGDFVSWMTSYLCPQEQEDILCCLKDVVPKEKLLQEVILQAFNKSNSSLVLEANSRLGEEQTCRSSGTTSSEQCASEGLAAKKQNQHTLDSMNRHIGCSPINGICLWQSFLEKDLKRILDELYLLRSSRSFSNLMPVVVHLKFLADVLTFYSNALDKIFYPVTVEDASGKSCSSKDFPYKSQLESLQMLLHSYPQGNIPATACKFSEKLCFEVESILTGISKHFLFQDTEVVPVIIKTCSHEMQHQLLYRALIMMPLGLLKCAITWFSSHLSEDESRTILLSIKNGNTSFNESFSSLLYEWFHSGWSGKTCINKFRADLQDIFKSRCSFLLEKSEETAPCPSKGVTNGLAETVSTNQGNKHLSNLPNSGSLDMKSLGASYYSGMSLHISFPAGVEAFSARPKFPGDTSNGVSNLKEPKPMDLIFFFHRAFRKDLEYLVVSSYILCDNAELLKDFCRRFYFLKDLYQIHSNAEDEIAFPALETKGKAQNIIHAYAIDHKLEIQLFHDIDLILEKMSELHSSYAETNLLMVHHRHRRLCMKLHGMCKTMQKILSDHIFREEVEIWPIFRERFSIGEQEKIVGRMLGRTRAEILKDMIPWMMAALSPEEQNVMVSLWRQAARKTMFDEWLEEWLEGYNITKVVEELKIPPSIPVDSVAILSTYLSKEVSMNQETPPSSKKEITISLESCFSTDSNPFGNKVKEKPLEDSCKSEYMEYTTMFSKGEKNGKDKPGKNLQDHEESNNQDHPLAMSQEELEATIRKVSHDSSLDIHNKSFIMQNLLRSRWIATQQKPNSIANITSNGEEVPGHVPEYRDPQETTFGCKHYKKNCKILAPCCNHLFTCRHCHDEMTDHTVDRKSITKMMCMKCLIIQPIGHTCSTVSCNNLSMSRYYCKICKIHDDERMIYHCPYCNLCRVGKGLGIDYFHCMNCNACMSRTLMVHTCREKCFEDNCPICHEFIFTSSSPVKALPCGHLMHSTCFQVYTCTHYTCPICSKSLGNMRVYFDFLDALLAEQNMPDEYAGQTQAILCNDCEKRGNAQFHWLYHKCPHCSSYNTRLL